MLIVVQKEAWRKYYLQLNCFWCKSFFLLAGIRSEVDFQFLTDKNCPYIFCANHFSTLDNFTLYLLTNNNFALIGDHKIGQLPLFGYLFKKMNICIDRENQASRNKAMFSAARYLRNGVSLGFAPEGGIRSFDPPKMHQPFQDGAFILAIRLQIPIVPVSTLTNHKILPETQPFRLHRYTFKAIIHKPIETKGMTMDDLESLKHRTFEILQSALDPAHLNILVE
jgi:1-acyl-sn-glycerol-3-phosphate acyltransferase